MAKIAMVSVLEGRGEGRVVPFLKEHYGFKEGLGKISPAQVDYEVVGGYLAHIRMPDKNTMSGIPYVFEHPGIDVLDLSSHLHSENLVFYQGKVARWRKTLHFIGEEEKIGTSLKDLTAALREHFWPEDFNRDLGAAVKHWYPDFEIK